MRMETIHSESSSTRMSSIRVLWISSCRVYNNELHLGEFFSSLSFSSVSFSARCLSARWVFQEIRSVDFSEEILTLFLPLEKIWMWSCTLEKNILSNNSIDKKPIWLNMTLSACLPTSSEWMISESVIEGNLIDNKLYYILQFSNIFSALMLTDIIFFEFLGGYRITHGAV